MSLDAPSSSSETSGTGSAGIAALACVIAAHAAYCAAYIRATSFVIEGQRIHCLLDDAMISMRYARHLADGHGLIWNVGGDRVEGITNPGWTLVMALVHLLADGTNFETGSPCLVVQIVSALILLANTAMTYCLARRLTPESVWPAVLAAAAVATFYPLNTWGLQGMEVGLLALLFTSSAYLAAGSGPRWQTAALPAAILACSTLVRPDAAVVAVPLVLAGASIAADGSRRYRLIWGAGALVAAGMVQTGLRLWYYGDLLPNTYYLKMAGFPAHLRIARGAAYTAYQVAALVWPAAIFALLALRRGDSRASVRGGVTPQVAVPLAAFVAAVAYSIYVGGDAWERIVLTNRYVTALTPCLFAVTGWFATWCWQRRSGFVRSRWPWAVAGGLWLVLINIQNGEAAARRWLLMEPPPFVEDNIRNVRLAREFNRVTLPGARIAMDYAGTTPYFCDREFVDLLGKSDRSVARGVMHRGILGKPPWLEFYPGHLKWDYAHSIGRLRPDVVCAIWRRSLGDSQDHLRGAYLHLPLLGTDTYWLKGSSRILWDSLPGVPSEVP